MGTPMDIHTRITAALHIVIGVLGASTMLIFALGVNWLRSFIGSTGGDAAVTNFFFGFGTVLAGFFALLLAAEAIAGIALLKGSQTGRVFVIAFGVLELLNFPIGTVIGVYTLWALLGKRPADARQIDGRP
ncbi:hypothetical protein C5614_26620 [Massilia phosphatilytica]|jgi:hypothetical protein|nr:hypothetical protein C5614_26620 [Massilia phosphatilytica]